MMPTTPIERKRRESFDKVKHEIVIVVENRTPWYWIKTELPTLEQALHKIKLDIMTLANHKLYGPDNFIKVYIRPKG